NGVNYFNVAPWTFSSASELWIVCAGSTSWSWNSSTVTFSYGASYTARSRMTDKASNPEAPGAGKTFVWDNASPASYIQYPEEGATNNINDSTSTLTIYGTASDAYSNVSKVELAIKKGAGNLYWDGSVWQSVSEFWVVADLWASSWTYTGVNCGDGSNHRIWVKAYDDVLPVNNKQAPTVGVEGSENSKFKYDITDPVSDISYPGKGMAYNVKTGTYTGTFDDPNFGSGVSEVKVVIRRDSDNLYWFGDAPFWSDETPLAASLVTADTFEFYISNVPEFYKNISGETPEEKYFIYTKARDFANNYEEGVTVPWTVWRSTFIYDTVAPLIAISTPSHLSHYKELAEIGGTAGDNWSGIDFVDVRISTNSSYFWTGSSWSAVSFWLNASGSASWTYTTLPAWRDGTIYKTESRVWDKAGNYKLAIATFTFDVSLPTATITTPAAGEPHYTTDTLPVNFAGNSADTSPGQTVKIYTALKHFSSSEWWTGITWTSGQPVWLDNATGVAPWQWPVSVTWKNASADEKHVFYAIAKDKAGNTQYNASASSATFWFQGNMPETLITKPIEGKYYNREAVGLIAIQGTSSYASQCSVRLQRPGGDCWDQSAKLWKSSGTFEWNEITGLNNNGADSWSLVVDTNAWVNNTQYKTTSKGFSALLNTTESDWGTKAETNKNFTMDLQNPSAGTTLPANGSYARELSEIKGTASDAIAGVREVKITLKDVDNENRYWRVTDSSWVVSVTWSTSTFAGGVWTFSNVPQWSHGHQYKIQPKAFDDINDGAGNFNEASGTEFSFIYDIVAPTAVVTSPSDGLYPSALSSIKGTQNDEFSVPSIFLQIKNKKTTTYWQGGWYTSEKWASCSIWASSWTYSGVPAWNNATEYQLKVKAWDGAGSTSSIPTSSFIFDNTEPDSALTQPTPSDPYVGEGGLDTIGGTASDAVSGVPDAAVKVQVMDLTLPVTGYWNGGGWQFSGFLLDTSGSLSWSKDFVAPEWQSANKYRIISKVSRDNATPVNVESTPYSFDVVFDTVPPLSRATYPSDNSKVKAVSQIRGTCEDDWSSVQNDWANYPLELEIVALANGAVGGWGNDEYWTGSSWTVTSGHKVYPNVFVSSWSYTFGGSWSSGREYKVTPKIYDRVPNEQTDISFNTFLFDNDLPACAVTNPDGNLNSAPSVVKGTALDNPPAPRQNSGISLVHLKIQDLEYGATAHWTGSAWTASETWFAIASGTWSYTVPYPTSTWTDGHTYKIWCKAYDIAGNFYENSGEYKTFVYDITEPESGVAVPVDDAYYPAGSPSVLSGTASDPGYPVLGTDIYQVKVRIQRYSDGWQYNPSFSPFWRDPGVSGQQWLAANYNSTTDEWDYTVPVSSWPWANGVKYAVWSRTEDNAGNYKIESSSAVFICDTKLPGASVVFPGNNSFLSNKNTVLVLHSSDTSPGIINETVVKIFREDNKYWDVSGDEWQDITLGEVWNTAAKYKEWTQGSVYKSSWTWTGGGAFDWSDGVEYKIASKGKDNAGNWSVVSASHTFKIDWSSGTSGVSLPVDTKFYKSLTQLQGTAKDAPVLASPSGIPPTGVKVRIKDVDTGNYWRGSVGHWGAELWLTASNNEAPDPDIWTYDDIDIADNSAWIMNGYGHKFEVTVKTIDRASNQEQLTAANTVSFYFDNIASTSAVQVPFNGASYNALALSSGSASDMASGTHPAGVKEVRVRIRRPSDGLFWKESTEEWSGSETWNAASGTTGWQISISTEAWSGLSGSSFTINSMAIDNVTEPSANMEVNYSTKTFWIDNVPPQSGLTKPVAIAVTPPPYTVYYRDISQITGTSSDDVKVAFSQISIKKNDSASVWNGSSWQAGTEYWIQSGGENVSPWTYNISGGTSAWTSGERYIVKSRATDTCDYDPNVETAFNTDNTKYFIFDNVKPKTKITKPAHDTGYDITFVENSKIEGTATDGFSGTWPAGVNSVQVALQKSTGTSYSDPDDLYWWDGGSSTSSFTGVSPIWLSATMLGGSPPAWEKAVSSTVWKSGRRYRVIARAQDKVPSPNIEDSF
ncbi:Ig-like domain repeat protein, partial [bacterium]|nr:Ig-like domain repeat protein [bacterium]